ncbi:MAG: protein-glutamate O-methyltransferase CheR [FCB group bacterium]|jgi:chemotaxis protein methyltransferase CheR|nr:protein-glutamate O-methyltransferase CheR [FCB group bacterium]
MEISIDEFKVLGDFIYRKTGIRYEEKKIYYLNKRVGARMDALGMDTVAEYVRHLRLIDDGSELQQFINLITVNETYFFREFAQLQSFAEVCLAETIERKAAQNDRRLRIWSAGCSSGEEPYTLAIILQEMFDDIQNWNIEIVATDIDRVILKRAMDGVYCERSVKEVPDEYLQKYFTFSANGTYRLAQNIKDMVRFEHLNLSDKPALRQHRGYDFIFCRNVLIYFDEDSRKDVVDHFHVALNRGGFIFLGSSESASRITTSFKIRRAGEMLVYFKE